jgi:RNA polymerase sigma-70 factor, ECF subfamily
MLGRRRTPDMTTSRTPGNAPDADTSDHALVADIADRSDPALAEAFRRYAPAVAGLARRVLGDEGLAQDVVQDVFVGLWDHPERFDQSRGSLRTLLLTQAHGRSVDIIRTREARKRREDRVAAEPEPPQPDVDAEFLGIAQAEAVRDLLRRPYLPCRGGHPRPPRRNRERSHSQRTAAAP